MSEIKNQQNFNVGEISPELWGRTDLRQYYNGAKELRNLIPEKQGGSKRRFGTKYIKTLTTPRVTRRVRRWCYMSDITTPRFSNFLSATTNSLFSDTLGDTPRDFGLPNETILGFRREFSDFYGFGDRSIEAKKNATSVTMIIHSGISTLQDQPTRPLDDGDSLLVPSIGPTIGDAGLGGTAPPMVKSSNSKFFRVSAVVTDENPNKFRYRIHSANPKEENISFPTLMMDVGKALYLDEARGDINRPDPGVTLLGTRFLLDIEFVIEGESFESEREDGEGIPFYEKVGFTSEPDIVTFVRNGKNHVLTIPKSGDFDLKARLSELDEDEEITSFEAQGYIDDFETDEGRLVLLDSIDNITREEKPFNHPIGRVIQKAEPLNAVNFTEMLQETARRTYSNLVDDDLHPSYTNADGALNNSNTERFIVKYRITGLIGGKEVLYFSRGDTFSWKVVLKDYLADGSLQVGDFKRLDNDSAPIRVSNNDSNSRYIPKGAEYLLCNDRGIAALVTVLNDGDNNEDAILRISNEVSETLSPRVGGGRRPSGAENFILISLDSAAPIKDGAVDEDKLPTFRFEKEGLGVFDSFNIYKSLSPGSPFGLLANTSSNKFVDPDPAGLAPDLSKGPPPLIHPFLESYPEAGTTFGQRTIVTGIPIFPRRMFLSGIGDSFNFNAPRINIGPNAASPINVDLSGDIEREIRVLSSGQSLFVGTESGEHIMGQNGNISALAVAAPQVTSEGTRKVRPVRVGNSTIYVQRSGRTLYASRFDEGVGNITSYELLKYSPSRFNESIPFKIATTKGVSNILWVATEDGKLHAMNYEEKENIQAWATCDLGQGSEVLDVRTISEGNDDVLLMVVKRKNGITLETLTMAPTGGEYLDSHIVFDTPPEGGYTKLMGLEHLKGQKVAVTGDGFVDACEYDGTALTVASDGTLDLPEPRNRVVVGVEYGAKFESLPVESVTQRDSTLGENVNVNSATVYLLDTPGVQAGLPDSEITDATKREVVTDMEVPIQGKTGAQRISIVGDYREGTSIVIEQRRPLPLHFVSFKLEGDFLQGNPSRRRRG